MQDWVDLVGWLPLGTGTLTLLLVYAFCLRVRRGLAQQASLAVWAVFVGFAAGAAAVTWAPFALLQLSLLPLGPALFQAVLTAAVYPALAIPFPRAHRYLAAPERA